MATHIATNMTENSASAAIELQQATIRVIGPNPSSAAAAATARPSIADEPIIERENLIACVPDQGELVLAGAEAAVAAGASDPVSAVLRDAELAARDLAVLVSRVESIAAELRSTPGDLTSARRLAMAVDLITGEVKSCRRSAWRIHQVIDAVAAGDGKER